MLKNWQEALNKDFGLPNVSRMLYCVFIAGLAIYLCFYVVHAYQSITYPYQLDYGEGYLLHFADNLATGHTIYPNITQYPFIPGLYSPVYPLVMSPLVKLFGLSFIAGRAVSVVSALLIGIALYKILRLKMPRRVAILAPLLFFASPYVFNWTVLYRVDTLGLLFSLFGVLIVLKYENSKLIYWSVPLFLVAVFTKQSYLVAPVASFIYLAFSHKWRAVKIAVVFGISGIFLFLLGNYLTGGQFYLHLITYQNLSPVMEWTLRRYDQFLKVHWAIFSLGLIMSVYGIIKKRYLLLSIYFILAACVAVTVGRPGAAGNYFLELIAISCVLSALLLKDLQQYISRGGLTGIVIAVALIWQLITFVHYPVDNLSQELQANQEISVLIKSTSGDILTEDAGMAVLNHKQLFTEWFMNTHLQQMGLWDESPFIVDLKNKRFDLIILNNIANTQYKFLIFKGNPTISEMQRDYVDNQRYTVEMLEAISTNYHITEYIGDYCIYKPN